MKRILSVLFPLFTYFFLAPNISSIYAVDSLTLCVKESGVVFAIGSGFHTTECKKNDKLVNLTYGGSDGVGATGATGAVGPSGANGVPGSTGATGQQGVQGIPGEFGSTGATGAVGEIGSVGATGSKGDIGPTGEVGPIGATGPSGAGSTGATGVAGEAGQIGATGNEGPVGPTGPNGAGSTGATGIQGPMGSSGAQGQTGTNGVSGYERILGTMSADDELQKTVTADCSTTDKKIIGGGFLTDNRSNSGKIAVAFNGPISDTRWQVIAGIDGTTTGDESFSIQAVAICVTAL